MQLYMPLTSSVKIMQAFLAASSMPKEWNGSNIIMRQRIGNKILILCTHDMSTTLKSKKKTPDPGDLLHVAPPRLVHLGQSG